MALAREWAAVPMPIDNTRDGFTRVKGQSYHCNVGGNAKCTAPSANDLKKVQDIAKILEDTKNLIKNSTNPDIVKARENFK